MPSLSADVLETIEAVKEYMNLESSDTDGLIRAMLNAVSADCQNRFTKRALLQTVYTDELYDGDGSGTIMLREWPVTTIGSLNISNHVDGSTPLTYGIREDYVWYANGKIVLLGTATTDVPQSVKVTYTAGYDGIENLPMELRLSIKMAVAFKYEEWDKKKLGVTSYTLADQSQVFLTDKVYPTHITDVWTHYRRKKFA